jgi:hypothetical protein
MRLVFCRQFYSPGDLWFLHLHLSLKLDWTAAGTPPPRDSLDRLQSPNHALWSAAVGEVVGQMELVCAYYAQSWSGSGGLCCWRAMAPSARRGGDRPSRTDLSTTPSIAVRKVLTSQVRMVFSAIFAGGPHRSTARPGQQRGRGTRAWLRHFLAEVLPRSAGVWEFRVDQGWARLLCPWRRTGAPSGREPPRRLCWSAGDELADAE